MAKLRRNHGSGSRGSGFGASLVRLGVLLAIVLVALVLVYPAARHALGDGPAADAEPPPSRTARGFDAETGRQRRYLPTGPSDQVVHHRHYSLGYDEDWEQARWVAYRLTPEQLRGRRVRRTDDFRPDPQVATGSAERADYRRSGYSRGHLAPAGDMGFAPEAMSETFYYSNMSPQLAAHNGAVWRELEETSRDWIREKGPTYVVTGPIVGRRPERIGANGVAVPEAFYRVLLTEGGEGVGFVIPHERQTARLESFAVAIDEVESRTGLDFFPELPEIATEGVEATVDPAAWPSSDRRYKQRLEKWNNQR